MTTQEKQDILNALKAESTDILALIEATSASGLSTIAVDSQNRAFRLPLDTIYPPSDRQRLDQLERALRIFGFPIDYTLTTDNMVWHTLKVNKSRYVRYDPRYDSSGYELTTSLGSTDHYLWAFVGNPFSGFVIYNKLAGPTKTLCLETFASGAHPLMKVASQPTVWFVEKSLRAGYDGNVGIRAVAPGGNNFYLNNYSGAGRLGVYVTGPNTDDGSNLLVQPQQ